MVVVGHGFEHLPRCAESQIGQLAYDSDVAWAPGSAGQFGEDDMASHHELTRVRQSVLCAVDIGFDYPSHIFDVAKPYARDQRDGPDIPGLIEIVAIVACKLF